MKKMVISLAFFAAFAACREKAGLPQTETTGSMQTTTASATTTVASGGSVSETTTDDKVFVSEAGMGGLAEVQMGNLALQNASSADVKAFAQRMVADHSKANDELRELATLKGLALPTEISGEHKKAFEHLSSLSGVAFDKAYMAHMVEDHEKDVAEFDKASTSATDNDVKAWAGRTLPTLQQHLTLAKETARKV